MIGYRRHSRRGFLGSSAALVALPFLESLVPRAARAQAKAPPKRFLGYYVPCGIRMAHWTPLNEGANYDLPPILAPLADLTSQVSVVTGLANRPARPDGTGDHASGTGAFLTCAHPFKTEGAEIANGISLDQKLAQALGGDTPLRSLELGIDGGDSAGGCDSGYSCAYARNIAWAGPQTPLPKLTDPTVVFDRLFGGFDPLASKEQVARRKLRDQSVLDHVLSDAKSLHARLGSTDQAKLAEYMTGVRELELRIRGDGVSCDPGTRPSGGLSFPDQVKITSDLMVLAMQCDVTRFITFMLGNAGSGRDYGFIGAPGGHHELSHHMDDATKLEGLTTIGTWEVTQLAYLLDRMSRVSEAEGSLLDHACVFFSSEIEDGNSHSHFNMPILLAGGAGGSFGAGRHLKVAGERSVADLFVAILRAFGLPDTSFGDSAGPLSGLG